MIIERSITNDARGIQVQRGNRSYQIAISLRQTLWLRYWNQHARLNLTKRNCDWQNQSNQAMQEVASGKLRERGSTQRCLSFLPGETG